MKTIHNYESGKWEAQLAAVVREYPLVLQVNGRELATLIASPHDLRYLVAGFLRLQGFVATVDDFHLLSVCEEFGIASVRIRGELPQGLRPVLTSGCGTGITFTLDGAASCGAVAAGRTFAPVALFRLMAELVRQARAYRSHGGIHSAAVGGVDGDLILFAEDVGRHNTIDRIAGEALLRGIDLAGAMLVTSGRVSAELAAKSARLGLALIASRTSATDMAIRMCGEAGITLVGYVRGNRFSVYTHPERLNFLPAAD
jgi:FdhD protein